MPKKFLRRVTSRYSKLGRKRKGKQVWRKPKGRDNKMREKRKGYPKIVSVGYGKEKKMKGVINDKVPVLINNLSDLNKLRGNEAVIIGKIGKKKRIEMAKIAKEKKIEIINLNVNKFLKKIEKEKGEKK